VTDEQNKQPTQPTDAAPANDVDAPQAEVQQPEAPQAAESHDEAMGDLHDPYDERLERLGGEPAPVITPEEFARLQRAGQVHIDARGRVRTTRRSDAEAGVSLRKRRAWYA
jgi:hypothetical protein